MPIVYFLLSCFIVLCLSWILPWGMAENFFYVVFIVGLLYVRRLWLRVDQLERKMNEMLSGQKSATSVTKTAPNLPAKEGLLSTDTHTIDLATEARLRADALVSSTQNITATPAPVTDVSAQVTSASLSSPTIPSKMPESKKESVSEFIDETQSTRSAVETQVKPSLLSLEYYYQYFFSGNPIAKIGVVILFVGVIFLLSLVSKYIYIPITLRLIVVAIAGGVMVMLGWLMHRQRPLYASILEGGGVGILYITIFMAFKVYTLLSPMVAFVLLLTIVALSAVNAIYHNAKSLAVMSTIGGFLAPLLVSSSGGSLTLLYNYYLILNIGVLAIAWFKKWPDLNYLAFTFTFILTGLWGWQTLPLEDLHIIQFYLYTFFVFYLLQTVLYSAQVDGNGQTQLLTFIILGTPIAMFGIEVGLVHGNTLALAYHALAMAMIYALTVLFITFNRKSSSTLLAEIYTALAVLFVTIAIPLYSMQISSSLIWAFEGLILMYIGIRLDRMIVRYFAALMQLATGVLYFLQHFSRDMGLLVISDNAFYLSAAVIGLASILTACLWKESLIKRENADENNTATVLLIYGFAWLYTDIFNFVYNHVIGQKVMITYTLAITLASALFYFLSEYYRWFWLRIYSFILLPVMVLTQIDTYANGYAFSIESVFVWLVSFSVLYLMLYRADRVSITQRDRLHLVSTLLLTHVIANSLILALESATHTTWSHEWFYAIWGIVTAFIVFIISLPRAAHYWPVSAHEQLYQYRISQLLVFFILVWFLSSLLFAANTSPMIYLPLLNPVDMTTAFCLWVTYTWCLRQQALLVQTFSDLNTRAIFVIFICLAFMWINVIILRTVHHWAHVPYHFDTLWLSPVAQTSISITWTIVSLITTYIAARYHWRWLWFAGFALIMLIVIKLFFIDLSHIGTIERMITFVTVGVLLMINGYISPMPPKKIDKDG